MNSNKNYDENEDSDYLSDFISSSENIFKLNLKINVTKCFTDNSRFNLELKTDIEFSVSQ